MKIIYLKYENNLLKIMNNSFDIINNLFKNKTKIFKMINNMYQNNK